VAALWESGCLGVEVRSAGRAAGGGWIVLHAWFPGTGGGVSARSLGRALRAAGLRRPPRLRTIADRGWVERWRRSLKPMVIGPFLVLPEGCEAPPGGRRTPIRVRFGRAFGTGEHATTRLALRLLRRHLPEGGRVADLGTGTGLLAIAAARLGAGAVLGVDDDPAALAVARDTVRLNRLEDRIALRHADAGVAVARGPFDLVLVNIGATVITRILGAIAAGLAPRGRAILTGFLVGDEPALLARAADTGLRPVERRRSRPWSALVVGR
jgi:ribosomal protein L11 methyltransferase